MLRFIKYAAAILAMGTGVAMADVSLTGSGATFPQPLYERMVAEYQKLHPDVKIDYTGIGSGGGIKGIQQKTIDFAGSDAPMSAAELKAAGGEDNIVEVPSCAGGVVPAYNVPGVNKDLNFSGDVLAEIFMGKINNWNDPKIVALNPGVTLPNLAVTPAYRTDGSGTNYVFTNYLATQNPDFKTTVGIGKQVQWPAGQGGKGSQGVAAIVQQTQGALGYIEQNFADKNNITYGAMQNKNGKFVKASPAAVSEAGSGAVDDLKGHVVNANIWNQSGDGAYPIASFTYLIVYKDLNNVKSKEQAQALANFLWWATHDGQQFATQLDYAPLSDGVQKKVEAALGTITYKGEAITIEGKK